VVRVCLNLAEALEYLHLEPVSTKLLLKDSLHNALIRN
jgi:hypothetical protein